MDTDAPESATGDSRPGGGPGATRESAAPGAGVSGGTAWADGLREQYLALGMTPQQASRIVQEGFAELSRTLSGIEEHALEVVPAADRVSILLPRLDVDQVAVRTGVTMAQAQSAMAMLVLDFATRPR